MKLIGTVDIRIDPAGLSAELRYSPASAEKGEAWDTEKVISLLFSRGVIEGFDPAGIEKAMAGLAAKGGGSAEIAKGIPPKNPTSEDFKWEPLAVPPNLREEIDRIMAENRPPVITIKRTETVRIRSHQRKKGGGLFKQQKAEEEFVTEKREIEEPVHVDPRVLSTGYVKQGDRLAVILPGKPGSAGKSVFGRPIPPPSKAPVSFHTGNGIERRRGELTALYAGLVRKGADWADILPLSSHAFTVTASADKLTAFLDFDPGSPDVPIPPGREILEAAAAAGVAADHLLSAERIEELLVSALSRRAPLRKEPISPDQDGGFSIEISEDRLKAVLSIRKGRGKGKPLVLKDVGTAIRGAGLKGLNFEKIKQDILEFYRGPSVELSGYVLAEGKPPTQGAPREFVIDAVFIANKERDAILSFLRENPPSPMDGIESLEEFPLTEDVSFSFVVKDQSLAKLGPVSKGDPGTDVTGKILDGIPGTEPERRLFENVKEDKDLVVAAADGILDYLKKDETHFFRIRPHRDSTIDIRLSEDRMQAVMTLVRSVGSGKPLSRTDVDAAVKAKGIVKGIDDAALSQAFEAAERDGEARDVVIANGCPARDARSSKVEFLIDVASGSGVTIDKSGKADYKHQDKITSVKDGSAVAKILAPNTKPEDGWDVTGKSITARQAPPINLTIGPNFRQEQDEEGNILLCAAKNGELVYANNLIDIRDVHTVEGDVDLKCGNIRFSGTVQVNGSVLPGFYVLSGGDIHINENADAALLSAEGSIIINQGVKGGGKGVLRAKKDILAGFVEQATVLCVGDVRVKNACLRCNIKANGKVSLESEKGNLVGGKVRARKGLTMMNLGSETAMKTEISFGQDYLIMDQIELHEREIQKAKDALSKIDFTMKKMESQGLREPLEKARAEKLKYLKIMEKRSLQLFTLRERFEEHFPAEVKVRGTLYPGVLFETHGRFLEVTEKKKGVIVYFDQATGHIKDKPLDTKKE